MHRARLRAGQQTLVFLRIEASLGLEIGSVVHERRGRILRELAELLVGDAYPASAVLLLEEHLHDQVIQRLVFDLTYFVLRQRTARAEAAQVDADRAVTTVVVLVVDRVTLRRQLLQDVADVGKARAWLASDEMKAAMEKGGVVGSPNVRFAAA